MFHKIPLIASVGLIGVAFSAAAFAAPPVANLEVQGTLKTPGCTVIAGEHEGIYDYGKLSPTMVKPGSGAGAHTALEPKTQTWTVNCDAPTFLSYRVIDNSPDKYSETYALYFGLGKINADGRAGYYQVYLSNAKVDGTATNIVWLNTDSANRTAGYLDDRYATTWAAATSGTAAKAGQSFSMDLRVEPYLAGSGDMGGWPGDDATLNGSMTINYAFGL